MKVKAFEVRKLVAVVLVVLLVGLMVGGVVPARNVTPQAECQSGHACGGMLETGSVAHRQHYARVVAPLAECQSGCACGG